MSDWSTDLVITGDGKRSRRVQKVFFAGWAAAYFDVFHFFFGISLFSRRMDLPALRGIGRKIVVHFRGSDIRNRDWLLAQATEGHLPARLPPITRPEQKRNLQRWRRWAHLMLVSTPDLREIVPEAEWVPQVIDLGEWDAMHAAVGEGRSETDRVVVVHTPTDEGKKGTPIVVRAVRRLQERGLPIHLEVVKGRSRADVAAAISQADVGIDQLLVGWYGNAAIEMMSARLPVLGFIREDWRDPYAPDLPIVSTSATDLERALTEVVDMSPAERSALGQRGREFVERHHSLTTISERLLDLYRQL